MCSEMQKVAHCLAILFLNVIKEYKITDRQNQMALAERKIRGL